LINTDKPKNKAKQVGVLGKVIPTTAVKLLTTDAKLLMQKLLRQKLLRQKLLRQKH